MRPGTLRLILLLGILVLMSITTLIQGCSAYRRHEVSKEDLSTLKSTLDGKPAYLKAHLRNGGLFEFSQWSVNESSKQVQGPGNLYDFNRKPISVNTDTSLALDSVAVFETNDPYVPPSLALLGLVTGASVGVTGYCAANPKACYGSCPTFYTKEGSNEKLVAEGFSGSIAPTLEATDWDPVTTTQPSSDKTGFDLTVRNEALETHVIREVNLLALPYKTGRTMLVDRDGGFFEASWFHTPDSCQAPEGDCRAAFLTMDSLQRQSPADEIDLAERESLEVIIKNWPGGEAGVVIAARQTLLPTFLFYQMLAYMGHDAGRWFADLEIQGTGILGNTVEDRMGGIEVLLESKARTGMPQEDGDAGWNGLWKAGEMREQGPLAVDRQVMPVGHLKPGDIRIKLRLAKGYWRLDQLALVRLEGKVQPLRLQPIQILNQGRDDSIALSALSDGKTLVQMPGDERHLRFELPKSDSGWELFLESRGYYWEWIRKEWLVETNYDKAALMVFQPDKVLRELAPVFKKMEPEMETVFWGSRYGRP